jgi:hypothetical protein
MAQLIAPGIGTVSLSNFPWLPVASASGNNRPIQYFRSQGPSGVISVTKIGRENGLMDVTSEWDSGTLHSI